MYLSRLLLNPRCRQVRRELAEPYEMHRTLLRAFPENMAAGGERVLFRVDTERETGVPTVLVQSLTPPDWSGLTAGRDYYLRPVETKEFDPAFRAGQRLYFRLRANPTVKREGKRWGLYREEEQRSWLVRKGQQGGFEAEGVVVIPENKVTGRKTTDGARHEMVHHSVRFDGVLRVSDPERFVQTLGAGVGSGKGLGFGMMSVRRGG